MDSGPPSAMTGITPRSPPFTAASDSDHAGARAPSLGLLQSRLRKLGIRYSRSSRSDSSTQPLSAADIKGPLGLNLLYEPSEPAIDFVFIHGLGGGSRKTWSHSAEPGMFWPKDWLPNEVGFKHVRIHSYGYNSDWTTRKESRLTVHDFGQALLADLYNSPRLRKNDDTPIILVAHSMGGLVAKKAYLLATRDPTYGAIGARINTIYFLGTPHRGADSAHFANLVRQSMGYGPKAFLDDLLPGSGTLDQINDEFRHVCGNINLWSFFESLPMSFGPTSSLVVEKKSAILGLPKEHVQYIHADHRQICKFDTPLNPNYLILQRAFLTTIEEMEADILLQRRDDHRLQMKKVAALLRVDQRPDAVLLATKEKQHHGSCSWVTEDRKFQEWVDSVGGIWGGTSPLSEPPELQTPKVLWLNGRPGTGKTIAAGHVIRYLQSCNLDCSFYFFRHEDKAHSTVAAFLRSLAFQMADSNFEVRRALVSMAEDGIAINQDDHHMIWTSLFVERIFKVEHTRPQFWVVDAIGDCSSKGLQALISMLSSIDYRFPARILLTSRPGGQVGRYLALERTEFSEIITGEEGSLRDIEHFLKARCLQTGDVGQQREMRDLVTDVLNKSNGSFLWASLTMANLENAYSIEDKQEILRQIPPEMDKLYSRILDFISGSPSSELAKCALKWTVCSPQPLHLKELAEAVKLDIGKTLTASGKELENMTGHLVAVDSHSRIRVAHQTTSAFLSKQRDDSFWIDRATAHSKIAEIFLTLLCSSDFAPPKLRRGAAIIRNAAISQLSEHASLNFSHHLVQGSSSNDVVLILLNKFLRSNVLTWIERVAMAGSLGPLQITAQRLKTYLGRRAKYQSPVSIESQTVSAWSNDMYHILAAFHSILLSSPSSIHFLIPHLCPPKSMISRLFAKPSKKLRIAGPIEEDWNDRLTGYLFPEQACAIACCSRLLAVGLSNGEIRVFHLAGSRTFDSAATLVHGKRVRLLTFKEDKDSLLLVSSSARKLQLWEVIGRQSLDIQSRWSRTVDFTPGSIAFSPDKQAVVLASPQNSALAFYEIADGEKTQTTLLHAPPDSESSDESDQSVVSWTPSVQIRLDYSHKLAALAYRNASVSIWSLSDLEKLGNFEKEGFEGVYATPQTLDMVFNPNAKVELLAVSYKDGDVVTCDPWTQEQTNIHHLHASLTVLSVTSDGRILAGAAEDGGVYMFLFETLQPIYRIVRPDDQLRIHALAFSTDNLRLFDIRGQSCNIWEPFVLMPKDSSDDSSSEPFSEEIILPESAASHAHVFQWGEAITAIEPGGDEFLFLGRQDGNIDISELSTSTIVEKLRIHDVFTEIRSLSWNADKSTLLSVDTTGRHIVTRIKLPGKGYKVQIKCILDRRDSEPILQAVLSPDAESVLTCSNLRTRVIRLDGSVIGNESDFNGAWWAQHPSNSSHLVAFRENDVCLFDWHTLDRISKIMRTSSVAQSRSPSLDRAWVSEPGSPFVVRKSIRSGQHDSSLLAVDASKITISAEDPHSQTLSTMSTSIHNIVGCLRSSLFFFDTSGWVCSINLRHLAETTHLTRHFFIPLTWRTGNDAIIKIISKTAVALGRGEQLFIFHGFLEFEDKVALEALPM